MHCVRKVTDNLYWVGASDKRMEHFENIHPLPNGTSYNSYLLMDEKTALFDTVDWSVARQFMENVEYTLGGRDLDYLVVTHMEPDHGSSLNEIMIRYPNAKIICSEKAKEIVAQFGFCCDQVHTVAEGEHLSLGKHELNFFMAPMVHWPEVMMCYESTEGILFSADAFGSFGSLDGKLFADEVDYEYDWILEARRYYTNIVGKYGTQVQNVLKKAAKLDIKYICSLHGLVWRKNLDYLIDKYNKWSLYEPEANGIMIAYASMYGDTENAAYILAAKLCDMGMTNVSMYDVTKTHVSYLIADAFRYSHIGLFSVTYNLRVFPPMQALVEDMAALKLQNRKCVVVENGTWAPRAGGMIRKQLEGMSNMTILNEPMTIKSAVNEDIDKQLEEMAKKIVESMNQ